jgi:ATP-dependent RNA helicase MSS116
MDYPDVTLVIQVGITTKDQYIHRLGRTARAGKTGNGVILCSPEEEVVLRSELSDFPLVARDATNFTSSLSADQSTKKSQVSIFGYDLITKIDNVLKTVPHDDNLREKAGQAWAAWLGFCKS